jgi:hypothetical protein
MATLRAAALILNGMLLLIWFIVLSEGNPNSPGRLLIVVTLFAGPIVNAAAIVLQARALNRTVDKAT